MRQVTINNPKLKKILEELTETVNEIFKCNERLQEIDKERNILGLKRQRLLDKTKPIVEGEKLELGEYEMITELKLKDGEPTVEIIDKIEEYKKFLAEQDAKDKQPG
jgi:vacuolar-type H+-ATPase subunit I/STV1